MRREDKRFLEITSRSAKLLNGHYSLKMPFRKEHPNLPNDLSIAKQRILGLRRFKKNKQFHKEYASCFTDIISKGYVEKIPQLQELCKRNCGWDDNLPRDIQQHWTKWLKELKMSEFKVC